MAARDLLSELDLVPCPRRARCGRIWPTRSSTCWWSSGVTGAGVALDAASRGVPLPPGRKEATTSGPPRNSSKMVYGSVHFLNALKSSSRCLRESGRNGSDCSTAHAWWPQSRSSPSLAWAASSPRPWHSVRLGTVMYDLAGRVKAASATAAGHQGGRRSPPPDPEHGLTWSPGSPCAKPARADDAGLTLSLAPASGRCIRAAGQPFHPGRPASTTRPDGCRQRRRRACRSRRPGLKILRSGLEPW